MGHEHSRLVVGDVDVARARTWIASSASEPVGRVANVLVDGSGRLGPLSYLVPDDLTVAVGDAVEVPFGKRIAYGMVMGAGEPDKATRTIERRFGVRATAPELAVAQLIATRHFCDPWQMCRRLAPTSGKGADPVVDRDAVLHADVTVDVPDLTHRADDVTDVLRRFAARPPGVDPAEFAATVAATVATGGQVLVLCPTVELVKQVTAAFASGARRIDTKATQGAWKGFVSGDVRIGVGTRTAALFHAPDLAAVVVVEQDHPGHVEQRTPHTHARDVTMLRSMLVGIPVILTGAVPDPAALAGGVKLVEVPGQAGWPTVVLSDRSDRSSRARIVTPEITAALSAARRAETTPVVLVERKRSVHRCDRCDALREHDCVSAFACTVTLPPCVECGAAAARVVGWDAPRIEARFAGRVRAVTLAELTGMRNAGVVIVLDLEPIWRRPVLSPDRDAVSVLAAAALAAGPAGTVIVGCDEADRPVLTAFAGHRSHREVAKVLWAHAAAMKLPPHGRLVEIRVGRAKQPSVAGWPGQVHGPRRVGGEWEILVRIAPERLSSLQPHIDRLSRPGKVRLTVS